MYFAGDVSLINRMGVMIDMRWRAYWIVTSLFGMLMTSQALNLTPPGYDHHLRPPGTDGGPVVIGISLRINAINKVDEKEMSIAMDVYFRATWKDMRLEIPKDLFEAEGRDSVPLNSDIIKDIKLWLPDPTIDRVREIYTPELIRPFSGVRLSKDGRLLWAQMFIIDIRCAMFFDKFPFDKQTCHLDISSYFYSTDDMVFGWEGDGINAAPDIPDALSNYLFTFHQENLTACHNDAFVNGEYPCLKSVMTITRRYRSFLIGVYFPSLIFVVVAWASFFWPPKAIPARTVLLITLLLSTISLYAGIQQITPPTNYTRAIDNWFFACIVAIASALFQYATILQIRKMQDPSREEVLESSTVTVISGTIAVKETEEKLDEEEEEEEEEEDTRRRTGRGMKDESGCCAKVDELIRKGRQKAADGKGPEYWKRVEVRVETGARILYLIFFFVFNVAYWTFYL